MSIVKYNSTVNDFIPKSFNYLINHFFNDSMAHTGGSSYSFVPRVDVFEDEKVFEIHVAVPGMNKDDFKIDLNDNRLTVSGERKQRKEKKEDSFWLVETQHGSFSRSFNLPENIDTGKIEASYKEGILLLTLPKNGERQTKTIITVK